GLDTRGRAGVARRGNGPLPVAAARLRPPCRLSKRRNLLPARPTRRLLHEDSPFVPRRPKQVFPTLAPMAQISRPRRRFIALTYGPIARAIRLFTYLYFPRTKVSGAKHVPRTGAVIFDSNHLDYLDPVILIGVIPRRAVFLAMQNLFD